ncbi:MAG: hypothetical protein ACYS1E_20065 [Planctomycetota bacterium]|jgi:hypothetical protein
MFKSIKNRIANTVNHENTQKALYKSIIATRKANAKVKKEATKLKNDTKQTWKDAMSADIS